MPMKLLNKLPSKAKKIYEVVYKKAIKDGKSPKDAAILAIGVVKKSYKQKDKKWVTKSTALKSTILKSGLFNKSVKFRIPITNTQLDRDNEKVSLELIKRMHTQNLIKTIGDVEHERIAKLDNKLTERAMLTDISGSEGLYILESVDLSESGELEALILMNKNHPLYSKMLKEHKAGKYLYASAEWENAKYNGNEIVDASSLGWTISNSPINYETKIKQVMAC